MTPAARISAAIDILDAILAGDAAEKRLIEWARRSRFAGSGDRAAVRDLVFDAVRRKRSLGWIGGADTGRGLMIGRLRDAGEDVDAIFTGEGHAPPALSDAERRSGAALRDAPEAVRLDCSDWLLPVLGEDLGSDAAPILEALRHRAPVFLRVNAAMATRDEAVRALSGEGIEAEPGPLSPTALVVTRNPRRVSSSSAYREGLVELQDAASQAVVDIVLPHAVGRSVLDFCAGGGGKALHLAAGGAGRVVAHDADPGRMGDIPDRARRGRYDIEIAEEPRGRFHCVLTDVPCSGSGAWRRQPEAKWRLTAERLAELNRLQDAILRRAADHVTPGGVLAYATCSLLRSENEARVAAFLDRRSDWRALGETRFSPPAGGDGFFVALLRRA